MLSRNIWLSINSWSLVGCNSGTKDMTLGYCVTWCHSIAMMSHTHAALIQRSVTHTWTTPVQCTCVVHVNYSCTMYMCCTCTIVDIIIYDRSILLHTRIISWVRSPMTSGICNTMYIPTLVWKITHLNPGLWTSLPWSVDVLTLVCGRPYPAQKGLFSKYTCHIRTRVLY